MCCNVTAKLSSKRLNLSAWSLLVLMLVVLDLGGCARWLGKPEPLIPATNARQSLYGLQSWHWQGRMSVQTEKDVWQAGLDWEHESEQDRLRLSGPLSLGMLSIVLRENLIYINEGNGVFRVSRDPEAELRDRLGISVPVSSLRYWILGLPEPGSKFDPLPVNATGQWGFRQSEWILRLNEFTTADQPPRKVSIQGPGMKIKLIVDYWEIRS